MGFFVAVVVSIRLHRSLIVLFFGATFWGNLGATLLESSVSHDDQERSVALTDAQIRKAEPKDKIYRMFDSGGLYIEVAPSGGSNTVSVRKKNESRLAPTPA